MPEIIDQQYRIVGIDEVQPHPANPRKGKIAEIGRSIERNDFYGAVVVQSCSGNILAGHSRWHAAKQGGLKQIPVIYVDADDATARRILAVDNRTSDHGGYDDKALAELLSSIRSDGDGFEGTGYDDRSFGRLIGQLGDEAMATAAATDKQEDEGDQVEPEQQPAPDAPPAPADEICPACGRPRAA